MATTLLSSHTARSLLAELIAGRSIETSSGVEFKLHSEIARRALAWYRSHPSIWDKNVQKEDVEAVVRATTSTIVLPSDTGTPPPVRQAIRQMYITAVRAHRFAGLHGYDADLRKPEDFVFSLTKPLVSVEGRNGSGKTSIINAITWCLTGYVHRPQRKPELTTTPLEVALPSDEESAADISVVSPVPPSDALEVGPANRNRVAIDTWVELTVEDKDGKALGTIRRTVTRSERGRLKESFDDGGLRMDPVAFEIGSRMPGVLPYIQLGQKSDFGMAVAILTGLRPIQQLAQHASRVQARLRGDLSKVRQQSIESKKLAHQQAVARFFALMDERSDAISLQPGFDITSHDGVSSIRVQLEEQQVRVLAAASVLGPACDLGERKTRLSLLRSVEPAIAAVSNDKLRKLPGAAVMVALRKLDDAALRQAEALLAAIATEADLLASVHADPLLASRVRLYARVAGWLREGMHAVSDYCPVCGSSIEDARDPRSGDTVRSHLQSCLEKGTDALQNTLSGWEAMAIQRLRAELPTPISSYLDTPLPARPHQILQKTLVEELFAETCFSGALSHLKKITAEICERGIHALPPYEPPERLSLPVSLGSLSKLESLLDQTAKLLGFARWRRNNDSAWKTFFTAVIGSTTSDLARPGSPTTLADCLLALRQQVETAEPLTRALDILQEVDAALIEIDKEHDQLTAYATTAKALEEIAALNGLIDIQINSLLGALMTRTIWWKNCLYRPATAISPTLATAKIAITGTMSMSVRMNGTIAPAHLVANASDLRASLFGFLFAFWEHLWETRGGFSLFLLDDIQELFDRDNRCRVAAAIPELVRKGAHVLCASNDQQFAQELAHAAQSSSAACERRLLHPISSSRACAVLGVFQDDVIVARRRFEKAENANDDKIALAYLEKIRIHAEERLVDLFDEVIGIPLAPKPTLGPLRDQALSRINNAIEPFALPAVRSFVLDPSLQQGSAVLDLLNRCHHAGRSNITFRDVHDCREELQALTQRAEAALDAYQRWLRRDQQPSASPTRVLMPSPLVPPILNLPILWELAAFTGEASTFGHPVRDNAYLTSAWFENRATYRITTSAFGFACPPGSFAIVDLASSDIEDRRLVIALQGTNVLPRRFLRNEVDGTYVALGSEAPNPLRRAPSRFMRSSEVKLLKVVGILFHRPSNIKRGLEAYPDDASAVLSTIEAVFRVEGESALPLALPDQMVLGAELIDPLHLRSMVDEIVAIETTVGAVLKRVSSLAINDHTILLEAIGGLGSSVVAHVKTPPTLSSLPIIKRARRVVGVLYDVQ